MNSKKTRQRLLLDEQGFLVASCDSIFTSDPLKGKKILPRFPLVESVFPLIRRLQLNDPEVSFGGVQTIFQKLPGIYDFTFVRMKSLSKDLILWIIDDRTESYGKKITEQQIKNEIAISNELLNRL